MQIQINIFLLHGGGLNTSTFYLNLSFVNKIKNYFNRALHIVPHLGFPLSETTLGTCPMDGCTQ